jgi:hypothetical protein
VLAITLAVAKRMQMAKNAQAMVTVLEREGILVAMLVQSQEKCEVSRGIGKKPSS